MRTITEKLRKLVIERSNRCCEYCLIPEAFLATFFHVDHIRSLKHGGKNSFDNLAYACPHCNQNKGTDVGTFIDEEVTSVVRFFNPRKDIWTEHFKIIDGEIRPLTPIGLATIKILDFNQAERVVLRQALISIGMYP